MRRAPGAGICLIALILGACSVDVPRNEEAGFVAAPGYATDASGNVVGSLSPAGGVGGGKGSAVGSSGSAGISSGATSTESGAAGAVSTGAGGSTASTSGGGSGSSNATSGSFRGVTKDQITVSVIAGFSGPLAGVVERAYDGLATWQEDVNAGGGINGRQVRLIKVDHKETADGGVLACKEALSNGSYIAIVPEGVDATLTAVSCLDSAGMPTLYYSATTDPDWDVAFADVITSFDAGGQMAEYVRSRIGGNTKKIGVMYVNQASYAEFSDAFVARSRELGSKLGPVISVEPNQASFVPQLQRMQGEGVQILVISATAEAVGIIRDARGMGYNPTFSGWGFQFDFVTAAGRDLFSGVTALRPYAAVDTPAYEKYAARMKARDRDRSRVDDLEGFAAYGHALALGEALRQAGPNPTWASFVAGAEGFRGWDNGILGPLSWSSSDHVGTHSTFPVVCCSSDWTWKTAGPPRSSY